jgi:hypothetical protein
VTNVIDWIPCSNENDSDRFISRFRLFLEEGRISQAAEFEKSIPSLKRRAGSLRRLKSKEKAMLPPLNDLSVLIKQRKQSRESILDALEKKYLP